MIVGQILKGKAITETAGVAPDATVGDAVAILSQKRIGALVVGTDLTHPDGILSERDVVRELGRQGPSVLDLPVSDLMTRKLITCRPDHTALEVLEQMTQGRFRHMPVMDGDKMIGLVSIGDVVKARLEELAMERNALEGMIMGH